jgi:hypothetical protein
LRAFGTAVSEELQRSLHAVEEADEALARGLLDAKQDLRRLERAMFDAEPPSGDAAAGMRVARSPMERELAESLRRAYSLVRRLVRVGTGLLRADTDRPESDGGEKASHAD